MRGHPVSLHQTGKTMERERDCAGLGQTQSTSLAPNPLSTSPSLKNSEPLPHCSAPPQACSHHVKLRPSSSLFPNAQLNVVMPSQRTVYPFCCQLYPNITLPEVKCPGGAVEFRPSHDAAEDLLASPPAKTSELHAVFLWSYPEDER